MTLDLFDPAFRQNPYPVYARLRREDPIHRTDAGWVLSRYTDISFVLSDPRFSTHAPDGREGRLPAEHPLVRLAQAMLFRDPPDHTRLRTLVSKAFTRRTVDSLVPRIEEITRELADRIEARDGEADLVRDIAYPLPIAVICELLGIPAEDREQFHEWSRQLSGVVDLVADEKIIARGAQAAAFFLGYFDELVPRRWNEPGDDVVSALVAAEDEEGRLTHDELLSTCVQLVFGGHETTQNLISNGMFALLQATDQANALREDPSLIRSAIEEMLRYDGPAQLAARWAKVDVELGDEVIREGQLVLCLIGAANRDPEAFSDQDSFVITRADNKHLTFGAGIHFCLGAPLARLEARIVIDHLVRRFPGMMLTTHEPEYRPILALRGLAELPVRLSFLRRPSV